MKNYKYEIAKRLVRNLKYGMKSVRPDTIEKNYYLDDDVQDQFDDAVVHLERKGLIEYETMTLGSYKYGACEKVKRITPVEGREMDLMRFMIEESNKHQTQKTRREGIWKK